MPWWWHTEEDTFGKHDMEILMQDCRLYALGVSRVLTPDWLPDDGALWERLTGELEKLDGGKIVDLDPVRNSLKRGRERLSSRLPLPERLYVIRRLNRALYCQRAPYFQDFRMGDAYIPGLSLPLAALHKGGLSEKAAFTLNRYAVAQRNRLMDIAQELERL